MRNSSPQHLLIATNTGQLARELLAHVRRLLPEVEIHGPFATEKEGIDYFSDRPDIRRVDYALVEHRLADGFGIDLVRALHHLHMRPIFIAEYLSETVDYDRQSVAVVLREELEAKLKKYLTPSTDHSKASYLIGDDGNKLEADLEGTTKEGPYRRRITQLMFDGREEVLANRKPMPFPMLVDAIAHFYYDQNYAWAVAFSGNLNPTPHTLDELEESLDPRDWFRINERQIIHRISINPGFRVEERAEGVKPGTALKLELYQSSVWDDRVEAEKVSAFLDWIALDDEEDD